MRTQRNKFKSVVSVILAAVMLLGVIPASAEGWQGQDGHVHHCQVQLQEALHPHRIWLTCSCGNTLQCGSSYLEGCDICEEDDEQSLLEELEASGRVVVDARWHGDDDDDWDDDNVWDDENLDEEWLDDEDEREQLGEFLLDRAEALITNITHRGVTSGHPHSGYWNINGVEIYLDRAFEPLCRRCLNDICEETGTHVYLNDYWGEDGHLVFECDCGKTINVSESRLDDFEYDTARIVEERCEEINDNLKSEQYWEEKQYIDEQGYDYGYDGYYRTTDDYFDDEPAEYWEEPSYNNDNSGESQSFTWSNSWSSHYEFSWSSDDCVDTSTPNGNNGNNNGGNGNSNSGNGNNSSSSNSGNSHNGLSASEWNDLYGDLMYDNNFQPTTVTAKGKAYVYRTANKNKGLAGQTANNEKLYANRKCTNGNGEVWYEVKFAGDMCYIYSGDTMEHKHSFTTISTDSAKFYVCDCGYAEIATTQKTSQANAILGLATSAATKYVGQYGGVAASEPGYIGEAVIVGLTVADVLLALNGALPSVEELRSVLDLTNFNNYLKHKEDKQCGPKEFRQVKRENGKLKFMNNKCLSAEEAYVYVLLLHGDVWVEDESAALEVVAMYGGGIRERDKDKISYFYHWHLGYGSGKDRVTEGGHIFFGPNDLGQRPTY